MKIKSSAAIALIVLTISACSTQKTLEESTYHYPNSSTAGTTVKIIAQRVPSYKLVIDDSITININPPIVLIINPARYTYKDSIKYKLYTDKKGQITINNLPVGDHRLVIQTTSNYPLKRINDTINITTKADPNALVVKTRKYKYRTAYKVVIGTSILASLASLSFMLALASLGGQ